MCSLLPQQSVVFGKLLHSCRKNITHGRTSDLMNAISFLLSDFKPEFYAFELLGIVDESVDVKINRLSGIFLLLSSFLQLHWMLPLVHAFYSGEKKVRQIRSRSRGQKQNQAFLSVLKLML